MKRGKRCLYEGIFGRHVSHVQVKYEVSNVNIVGFYAFLT